MKLVLICLAVISLSSPIALGQTSPCKVDIEKYCKGVKPGKGRLAKCLVDKYKSGEKISGACVEAFRKARKR